MGSFIVVLIVIVGILLGLVILVQNPKGGGLASGFTGATKIGGVQRTADFLEKSTWYLGAALFVLCLLAAKFYQPSDGVGTDEMGDEVIEAQAPVNAGGSTLEEAGAEGAGDAAGQGEGTDGTEGGGLVPGGGN